MVMVMVRIIINKMAESNLNSNVEVKQYHCTACNSSKAYPDRRLHKHGGHFYVPFEKFELCDGASCEVCKQYKAEKTQNGKCIHIQIRACCQFGATRTDKVR